MSAAAVPARRQLTWLITGASSGFGLALAREALSRGDVVVATSRDPARTPELVAEVESHHLTGTGIGTGAGGSRWLQLDVDDPERPAELVSWLEQRAGLAVDVLVNNAGYCVYGPAELLDAEGEARAMLETMYLGPLRLIQAVLPGMRSRGRGGAIVNISSGAALDGTESMAGYAGAKAALDAMTRVLAKEVEPFGVRTLTVNLGTCNTGFAAATRLCARQGEMAGAGYDEGSAPHRVMRAMASGSLRANSDAGKAMRALCDVVRGEGAAAADGIGKGKKKGDGDDEMQLCSGERILPLGADMTDRVRRVGAQLSHALEVFAHVTNSIGVDEE